MGTKRKLTDTIEADSTSTIGSISATSYQSETSLDNFRDVPVIPRPIEITRNIDPPIRSNQLEKEYENLNDYLDVQFRLLREDYIRPLREGIAQIKQNCYEGSKKKRSAKNVKIYERVKVNFIKPDKRGVLYGIQFDVVTYKNTRWQNCKLLQFGNLLCLSCDFFEENAIFAVVADRDPKQLKTGCLVVQLVHEETKINKNGMTSKDTPKLQGDLVYTMVESEAYFVAYRYVLAALKETKSLPLERYVVECSEELELPDYLRASRAEDRCIRYSIKSLSKQEQEIDILSDEWPEPVELELNQSQGNAVKLALTKELAIIQGPPGTGKTHVGLAIMRLLLDNKDHWCSSNERSITERSPILVVCYTNHALDQFLEGIAKFHKDIVRIGSRCTNDVVEQFSLKTHRKGRRNPGIGPLLGALERVERHYDEMFRKWADSSCNLRPLDDFKQFMRPDLYAQFRDLKDMIMDAHTDGARNAIHPLPFWLSLSSEDLRQAGSEHAGTSTSHGANDHRSRMMEEERSLDGIAEEADYIQEQRLLDTDYFDNLPTNSTANGILLERPRRLSTMIHIRGKSTGQTSERPNLEEELNKSAMMSEREEQLVDDINQLSLDCRWRLYRTWLKKWRDLIKTESENLFEECDKLADKLKEQRKFGDGVILKKAGVVAATTTGAAINRDLICNLNCKIVVVEEAAEVLEAHIITALPRTTEHLILIGDHKQLRPSPTVYELGKQYNLDVSLFERLIKRVPHVTLTQQHRMRPEVASLLRPHIYENLQDHESVHGRGSITGIQKPVFFLSHTVLEEVDRDGQSKKNQYEADFLVKLCDYIITQGYDPKQITILTMYRAQLTAFRRSMFGQKCHKVKATTVDNFQGEENDIILLSLVRSNKEGAIGFVGVENRVCVALSRAKMALYCVGNMELFASKSSLWQKIVGHLRENESTGESLRLQCKHHPDRIASVKGTNDFSMVPEGGCMQMCEANLDCGHICPRRCHPEDHSEYHCKKPCEKSCKNDHKCKKTCGEECGPCYVKMWKIVPNCEHSQNMCCFESPSQFRCKVQVSVKLKCGHHLTVCCYKSEDTRACLCKEKCLTTLMCGHSCTGSCADCLQGRLHVPCRKQCSKTLLCGHQCNSIFCSYCPPCQNKCLVKCAHRECTEICGMPCIPCRERCTRGCRHSRCRRLCGEPCDREPCNRRCTRLILKCQHQCIGFCGEPCPALCRFCNRRKLTAIAGNEDISGTRFVLLQDCGHVHTSKFLDRWMNEKGEENTAMKKCPKCGTLIRRSARYGSIINNILNSLNEIKQKTRKKSPDRKLKEKVKEEISRQKREEDYNYFPEIVEISQQLREHGSRIGILIIEERFRRLKHLKKLKQTEKELKSVEDVLEANLNDVAKDIKHIAKWICLPRNHPADQEEEDFRSETKRIKQAMRFIRKEARYQNFSDQGRKILAPTAVRLQELLIECPKPYGNVQDEEVQRLFSEIPRKESHLTLTIVTDVWEEEDGITVDEEWPVDTTMQKSDGIECDGATVTDVWEEEDGITVDEEWPGDTTMQKSDDIECDVATTERKGQILEIG